MRVGIVVARLIVGDAVEFIVEDVAEALGEDEDEGEDVIFIFRSVLGSTNGASGDPDPGFW